MKSLSEIREKILRKIWETENPVTLQEIAEKTGLKVRSVNMNLLGLIRSGFVTMSGDRYVITKKGKELIGLAKIDKETAEKILSKRLQENAFHFYIGVDQPLGVSSDSLTDLCERIITVDIRSIDFHIARGDFESWISFLGDAELAKRLELVREESLAGEALREKLCKTLNSRRDELRGKIVRAHSE